MRGANTALVLAAFALLRKEIIDGLGFVEMIKCEGSLPFLPLLTAVGNGERRRDVGRIGQRRRYDG